MNKGDEHHHPSHAVNIETVGSQYPLPLQQGQKLATKSRNPFSGILQESMDSRHITLYDKLKYVQESI